MAVPSVATYSAAAKIAANTEFLTLLDAGAGAALMRIRDASDVLLAEITLTDPAGTVNGTTGVLTLDTTATEDTSANASGTAAYGEFCDSDGTVHLSLPAQEGSVAVSGKLVLNTLNIIAGGPVILLSVVIG